MYKIYGDMLSGNCYKIKLLMKFLQIEHEWIHVDILKKETQTDAFKAMNPNGKIPLLVIKDGVYLSESNAILNYLAEGSSFLPADNYAKAKVLEWQFFEQYSHEPYIAVARYINKYLGLPKEYEEQYKAKQAGGHKALAVMETQLKTTPFLTGATPTIADISLYGYTHVAAEGGFDLSAYPSINQWLQRFEEIPGYVVMER